MRSLSSTYHLTPPCHPEYGTEYHVQAFLKHCSCHLCFNLLIPPEQPDPVGCVCTVLCRVALLCSVPRSPTTCAASSPTTRSPLSCSMRSAAGTRSSTWGCWRTCACAGPASPTARPTRNSCTGESQQALPSSLGGLGSH